MESTELQAALNQLQALAAQLHDSLPGGTFALLMLPDDGSEPMCATNACMHCLALTMMGFALKVLAEGEPADHDATMH